MAGGEMDAYERFRRLVESGSCLPEEANAITSGSRRHFDYYRFEAFEGEGLALSQGRFRFLLGWRKAANGDIRDERYAEGWDAFAERYPDMARWDEVQVWDCRKCNAILQRGSEDRMDCPRCGRAMDAAFIDGRDAVGLKWTPTKEGSNADHRE